MTCIELQDSLAEVEDGSSPEQIAHLRDCPMCSALVKELNLIIVAAERLREADEPSPRVWNSIEIALRREGLIRPQPAPPFTPSFITQWRAARWFVPVAAALVLAAAIFLQQRSQPPEVSQQASVVVPAASGMNPAGLNDEDLMQEVSDSAPAMKSVYQDNLQRVNQSIRESQDLVSQSPNDEDARRSLMEAYQQKSMLFELAMDRSLP
jgi:hypothetical protein